jgi:hypothetical protein
MIAEIILKCNNLFIAISILLSEAGLKPEFTSFFESGSQGNRASRRRRHSATIPRAAILF